MTESVPVRRVPIPAEMTAETATYVGVLEGTLAALCVNEAKYRCYLEMLTGEPWEETRIDYNGNMIRDLAVSALVRQTGMDHSKAVALVEKRWNDRNLPKEQVIPVAVPPEEFISGDASNRSQENNSRPEMSERFRAWRDRQVADAADLDSESVPVAEPKP